MFPRKWTPCTSPLHFFFFLPFHNVFVSPSATARKTRPLSTFLLQKQSSVMLYIRNVQRDENFTRRGFDQTSFKQRTCLQEHFFTTLTITSLRNSRNNKKRETSHKLPHMHVFEYTQKGKNRQVPTPSSAQIEPDRPKRRVLTPLTPHRERRKHTTQHPCTRSTAAQSKTWSLREHFCSQDMISISPRQTSEHLYNARR